jgi:hypothetical protein
MSYYDDPYEYRMRPYGADQAHSRPQSGFGIASLVVAVVVAFMTLGVAGLASPHLDEDHPAMLLIGLAILADMLLALVGGILGLVGLMQANRGKVAAVIGLVLNGLVVFGVIGLVIIGLLSE